MLSYAVWEREFQLNPAVLGQRFRWKRGTFTVVGVLPATFRGVEPLWPGAEIYLPLHGWPRARPADKWLEEGRLMWIPLLARLKAGVHPAQIEPLMTERWRTLSQGQDTNRYDKFLLLPGAFHEFSLGSSFACRSGS